MATGTSQAPITCGICKSSADVNFFCLTCKGNLCIPCQNSHVQAPMFENHNVVPIQAGLQHKTTEDTCYTHTSSLYSMHCNDCKKLICSKCISSGEHKGHDIGDIEAALENIEREIKEYHDTLETIYLPQFKSEEVKIKQNIAECKTVTISLKSNINDKRTEMIKEIHKQCDDLIVKVEDEEKHHILDMDKAIQKLHDPVKETELLMSKSREALTYLASEKITFNQQKPILKHLCVPTTSTPLFPTFKPGTLDKEQISVQIGELLMPQSQQSLSVPDDFDVSIIQRNKVAKIIDVKKIYAVSTVDTNKAWVLEDFDDKYLRLVNIDGKETYCLNTNFAISLMAVTTSGDIMAIDYFGKCIRIMTQTGQVTHTIKTYPNYPSGICLGNNNEEIVVCVNTPHMSKSKLVVYSRDGIEIRTINYTDKPVRKRITQRVTQNNRGDYCVAHRGQNKVYVVDSNGAQRYTYDGSGAGKMKRKFFLSNICSDIFNHLFISDNNNHNIHMLDDEGKFLRFILTEQDGIINPSGLCFDRDGRLWVVQENGELCIVKLLK